MLFKTPDLDKIESEVLQKIDFLRESLRYVVNESPRRWQGLLRRALFARAIQGSNSIEGYAVSVEDAVAAIDADTPLDASDEVWAAVTGYRTAMTCVLQIASDPWFTYSADWIRSLHFMMMQHDLGKNPGKWRPGAIFVRDDDKQETVYEGPDAALVPGLAQELVGQLAAESAGNATHPVIGAAMAHLNLVMIHPFSDGNGRMARCLQSLVLARAGRLAPQFSSIEEFLGRDTRAYYEVLRSVGAGAWNPGRDAREWVRYCLKAHFIQASRVLRRSREYDKLWVALEDQVERHKLPSRIIYALMDAGTGYYVRNATYRRMAEVTDQLASRDLAEAVRAGLLIAQGERRGRRYIASPKLADIRAKTREDKKIADPFAEPAPVDM